MHQGDSKMKGWVGQNFYQALVDKHGILSNEGAP